MPRKAQLLYVMGPLPLQMAMWFPAARLASVRQEAEGGKQIASRLLSKSHPEGSLSPGGHQVLALLSLIL